MSGARGVPSLRLRLLLNDPIAAKRLFVWPKKSEGTARRNITLRRMSPVSGLRFQFQSQSQSFSSTSSSAGQMSLRVGKCKLKPATSTSQCNFLNEIPIALGSPSLSPLFRSISFSQCVCVQKLNK